MRLSGLVVATLFFLSSFAVGQHSSSSSGSGSSGGSFSGGGGGGGSHSSGGSSSSSAGSGGGSHSGSSGGGASSGHASGGSHSSGGGRGSSGSNTSGSNSHGSIGSGSGVNSSGRSVADRVRSGDIRVSEIRAINEKNESVVLDKQSTQEVVKMVKSGKPDEQIREFIRTRVNASPTPGAKPDIREHKGLWSFLRHPSRKPETRVVVDLRKPVCLRGPCQICPGGQTKSGGCGTGTVTLQHLHQGCYGPAVWTGAPCVLGTHYLDDCNALRTMMEREAQRMQAAESIRQSACAAGASSECSEATASWQSEQNWYRLLQQRYEQCRTQSGHPLSGSHSMQSHGMDLFDPMRFDARY